MFHSTIAFNTLWTRSDHRLVQTTLAPEWTKPTHHSRTNPVLKLKPDLTIFQIKQILEQEDWPDKEFIEIAKETGLTKTIHVSFDHTVIL